MLVPADLFFCALLTCTSVGVQYCKGKYLSNTSQPTMKTTKCEILPYMVFYLAKSWNISQGKQVGYELV